MSDASTMLDDAARSAEEAVDTGTSYLTFFFVTAGILGLVYVWGKA